MRWIHTTVKIAALCAVGGIIVSCSPVHRFTRVKKIPREYSLNYCVGEVKAPKTDLNKEPWIVFSDHEKNQTYNNVGGKVKHKDVDYLDPFLVIKQKNDYLRLIKYTPDVLKNGKLDYKKAEYCGWMRKSDLLLSQQSETDVFSGKKNKMLVMFSDTLFAHEPDNYFAVDSVKTYKDFLMSSPAAAVSPYSVIYRLKQTETGDKSLIAKKPYLKADDVKTDVLGWIDNCFIKDIGAGLHADNATIPADALHYAGKNGESVGIPKDVAEMAQLLTKQYKTIRYNPVASYSVRDSLTAFRTRTVIPLFDYNGNYIFNVNGGHISQRSFRTIAKKLRKINVSFVFEGREQTVTQFPQIVNALQNLQPLFEQDRDFSYRFNCVMVFDEGFSMLPFSTRLTPNYSELMNLLAEKANRKDRLKTTPLIKGWEGLSKALKILDDEKDAVNLIVLIGEKGYTGENVDETLIRRLIELNCRILGFQVYAGEEDEYNDFVLAIENMIYSCADGMIENKKELLVSPAQIKKENSFREYGVKNSFRLDFPECSITQGFLYFPQKAENIALEVIPAGIDTILQQVRRDNLDMTAQMLKAFNSVGNNRTRFDSLYVRSYGLDTNLIPSKKLISKFNKENPGWYLPSKTIVLDSAANNRTNYSLMLSELELKEIKAFFKTLTSLEVDFKFQAKAKKTAQGKKTCNCPENDLFSDETLSVGTIAANVNDSLPPEYASTRKIRKQLYKQYLTTMNYCKYCKEKRKTLKRMSLAEVQRRITGCPTSGEMLNKIRLKDLNRKKYVSDKMLDELITYLKKKSGDWDKAEAFESNGEKYYWLERKFLP
ncbi:MAG: hypothetical protein LBD45_00920 [Bacteroidales bacterium]|jgi:hypothetical protein|nr:hypothetical protein [Bacteroidales bacterium]